MRPATKTIASAAAGAVGWTALEYLLHRFAMHELKGKGLASREHLTHHADVTYFSPTSKKLLSAAGSSSVVFPVSLALIGKRDATALTGGMLTTYAAYEVAHRRTHTHPPTNRFGRWMRRSHMHHHFGAPMRNFGVTSPVWDKLFRTYDDPGVVTMPRRMAPAWLLDEDGEVKEQYRADYVVKGRARPTGQQVEQDRRDAFTNIPPLITPDEVGDPDGPNDGTARDAAGVAVPVGAP